MSTNSRISSDSASRDACVSTIDHTRYRHLRQTRISHKRYSRFISRIKTWSRTDRKLVILVQLFHNSDSIHSRHAYVVDLRAILAPPLTRICIRSDHFSTLTEAQVTDEGTNHADILPPLENLTSSTVSNNKTTILPIIQMNKTHGGRCPCPAIRRLS